MPEEKDIERWKETIFKRYENYLKTSFYFKDPDLRASFRSALRNYGLLKGPFAEPAYDFKEGVSACDLAEKYFPGQSEALLPALLPDPLYAHQENSICAVHEDRKNVVVATGTASGKTEAFLYPVLFDLYRQHLDGRLDDPGVRAMVLYPMNALANDQRRRLGDICELLQKARSDFAPTFGQYIGQTPENRSDRSRNASMRQEERLCGESVFREDMWENPPHILLTNYSMLEYLLIRPDDSPLFDEGRGVHWQFIVLDEAHQYRGAKGMEMGMLLRRLKQRLREGGRKEAFRCIATSATIVSGAGDEDRRVVADFSKSLFDEPFTERDVVFGEYEESSNESSGSAQRFHIFLRALEGAFLLHKDGKDEIVLNRETKGDQDAVPLEIALCRECGQHYYVGRCQEGVLKEAVRDPSQTDFGVDYYLPSETEKYSHFLCRCCGELSTDELSCDCKAGITVEKCPSHKEHRDQLKECASCNYRRGGIGDPVHEIVHGSDGPNTVIATALHGLLPKDGRKVLAFADSRQEAAFFAWYAEDSYRKLRDRNLLLRALRKYPEDPEGLSINDVRNLLVKEWDGAGLFNKSDTSKTKNEKVFKAILGEALTDERRLSLAGVGLVKWFVEVPDDLKLPGLMQSSPWNLSEEESLQLTGYLLDELRSQLAMELPEHVGVPVWGDVCARSQQCYCLGPPGKRNNVREWGAGSSAVVKHFLRRILKDSGLSDSEQIQAAVNLMKEIWESIVREYDTDKQEADKILCSVLSKGKGGTFRLNSRWLRVRLAGKEEIFECDTCGRFSAHNIRGVCPRNGCPGSLAVVDIDRLKENHYRVLYESSDLPPTMLAEEHTAQIESDMARRRQERFKNGHINLLSSSTTFEVGVDLGDLEVVFLRNVPPESFNYTQRAGRAGRREIPGLVVTYCRRNPHDLYHYQEPQKRVIKGEVRPPQLHMNNEKIVLRHMVAVALSAFFKREEYKERFENVQSLISDDWNSPKAVSDLRKFCLDNFDLKESLRRIVPSSEMIEKVGLEDGAWIDKICGEKSRFDWVQEDVCKDYRNMERLKEEYSSREEYRKSTFIKERMKTIAGELTLTFLSRNAIIPKYGFPVDVVELDTRPRQKKSDAVSLQRDLSQAIAEYAPASKVVANKLEWESCGVKIVPGKRFPIRGYSYDDARNFQQWGEDEAPQGKKRYLSPIFGFVTPLFDKPKEPSRRTRRLYTTRPFFKGFDEGGRPKTTKLFGVFMTQALPGSLVVLCEGKNKEGFYICLDCGTHMVKRKGHHKTPENSNCEGTLKRYSLGHEMVTDVMRLQFPELISQWDAYSLGYAVLLGAAEILNVPDTDLNVTITGSEDVGESGEAAIVLYDNVPGGAGLVVQLEQKSVFRSMLEKAGERVQGNCKCDSSCYGCLRSYRNQFAHPHLDREAALKFLNAALDQG